MLFCTTCIILNKIENGPRTRVKTFNESRIQFHFKHSKLYEGKTSFYQQDCGEEDKITSRNLRNFEGPRVLFTTSSQFGNVILKAIKLTALKSRDQNIDQIDT